MTAIENYINKTILRRLASVKRDYGTAFDNPINETYVPLSSPGWETEFSEQEDGIEVPEYNFEIVNI